MSDIFSLGCVFIEILSVLEPQAGLREFGSRCYWEKIDGVRDVLVQRASSRLSRCQLLCVCCDMLEPKHENRISSGDLLAKMNFLRNPLSGPVFKCFCSDRAPVEKPEDIPPVSKASTQELAPGQDFETTTPSVSIFSNTRPQDGPAQKEVVVSSWDITLNPTPSLKR